MKKILVVIIGVLVTFSFSAHTIFVKRDRQNQSAMTAYNNGYDNKFSTFYQFYTSNYDNRNTQFISGVTIKG